MWKRDWSPTFMKRGSVPCITMGSRDDDVSLALSDLASGPGGRHDPHSAVEGGDVELDAGGPVRADLGDAGVTRERLEDGRGSLRRRRCRIAARADGAARALKPVDQKTVEIAKFKCELPLTVEILARLRRLVAGQVEDADIDGRHGDIGLFASLQSAELHRNGQLGARVDGLWRRKFDRKHFRRAFDGEPGDADRAARRALRGNVQRAVREGDDVSARSPFGLHGQRNGVAARRHVDDRDLLEFVGDDGEGRLDAETRIELQLHRLAGGIGLLVERHVEHVGRVGGALAIPADGEIDARLGSLEPDRLQGRGDSCRV